MYGAVDCAKDEKRTLDYDRKTRVDRAEASAAGDALAALPRIYKRELRLRGCLKSRKRVRGEAWHSTKKLLVIGHRGQGVLYLYPPTLGT